MTFTKRFKNTKELSEYLDVSINTIYYWVETGQIPHYKLGANLKFDNRQIEDWLERKKADCR
jgi:excisionase family DNA binding protein